MYVIISVCCYISLFALADAGYFISTESQLHRISSRFTSHGPHAGPPAVAATARSDQMKERSDKVHCHKNIKKYVLLNSEVSQLVKYLPRKEGCRECRVVLQCSIFVASFQSMASVGLALGSYWNELMVSVRNFV